MTSAEKVEEVREAAGVSRAELARRLGMDRRNLWRLLHERRAPAVETLRRLGDALGVPWHELAGD